uniref:Angiotensin-converting enzyme n=1 Tax=Timema poppense TaxID=170557 RepID=A0A7R9CVA2_TIMPO|nr:unnamed protein product [Timema poppensis]
MVFHNPFTQIQTVSQLQYASFQRAVKEMLAKVDREHVQDPKLWRQVQFLTTIGPAALPPHLLDRYNRLINDMLTVYDTATICAYNDPFKCGLKLEPELTVIMARSRDWDELQYVWTEWRRKSGQKIRDLYEQLVDLSNQAAKLNNLKDTAEYWMFPYDSPTFRFDVEDVWEEVKPLYELMHAYVRRKLRDLYGNMWGQSWSNILDVTIPYPGKNFLDVTPQMIEQGYNSLAMFRLAEDFYQSMNMSGMPPEFWAGSVLEELPDRIVICQPSAWDFCNRRDYR